MVTHFLGKLEVAAYLNDFLRRLKSFNPSPEVWCPLTRSGDSLLERMIDTGSEALPRGALVIPVNIDRETKQIRLTGGSEKDIRGRTVLLFDGAVHSGVTMSESLSELLRLGAANVCTYTLVIKRSSSFIPTFWGVMIDDSDRAFFSLDSIPNNRLNSGTAPSGTGNLNSTPCVHLRRLADSDGKRPPVKSGVNSLDRITWEDRLFDMKSADSGKCTYLLQKANDVVGFLTLTHKTEEAVLLVDEIAISQKLHGGGFGSILLRFADTLARHLNCKEIRLRGIETQVVRYEKFGYKQVPGSDPFVLDEKKYYLMVRRVLYHIPLSQLH